MNQTEMAYKAAQIIIAQVAEVSDTKLLLTGEEFSALDRIPPEISQLSEINEIILSGTLVKNLAPLANLRNLHRIDLNRTPVADIEPLTELTNLKSLRLDRTQVEDLTALAELEKLFTVWLDGTRVKDLAPLAELKNLYILRFPDTQITELAPLGGLKSLGTIRAYNTQVSDLAPIAQLKKLRSLSIQHTKVKDLSPLAGLKYLQQLQLQGTQINDLVPISNLKFLRRLDLEATQVSDLRPLVKLTGLENLPKNPKRIGKWGLSYSGTPATASDTHLADLAKITDYSERTSLTMAYLRSLPPWPEPYNPREPFGVTPLNPPEQDPALPLIWGEKGFSFFAKSIDTDPVTEAALEDLRALLEALRRKGNRHDDLYHIAGELQERSVGAVPDLNMVKLHLSYQKLRRLHMGRAARENKFDDETISAMEAIFEVLPGVTLADNGVRTLIERQEAERNAGLSKAQHEAAAQVLKAVQEVDAPFAPEVKDIAIEILRPGSEDRLSATRGLLSRNVVIGALRFVGSAVAGGVIAGPVGNFVYEHWGAINTYVVTMGDDAFFWAQSIFSKFRVDYEIAMGIVQESFRANVPLQVVKKK